MKSQLAALTGSRDEAIRRAVENAPDRVARDDGLLSQLAILKHIADNDQSIKAVVILIDITSFGFELAAVLVKITSYVPTTYAALLARDAYLRVIHMVEEMMDKLNGKQRSPEDEGSDDPSSQGSNEVNAATSAGDAGQMAFGGVQSPFDTAATSTMAPKRPRGRPRKVPIFN